MHRIEKISVDGFWGEHKIETRVFPDVTFFIGVNGTGKTTLINLLAAALVCDFDTLDTIAFSRIEVGLDPLSGNKKPSVIVTKKQSKKTPFPHIDYEIKDSKSGESTRFSLDDIQEQFVLRRAHQPLSMMRRDFYRTYAPNVIEKMKELVKVSWLSIHRAAPGRKEEDRAYESTVDRKIYQLNNELVRYFSSLSKQRDEERNRFQEYVFLSLIDEPTQSDGMFNIPPAQFAAARADLTQIFHELRLSGPQIDAKLESFYARINKLAEQATEKGVNIQDFIFMLGVSRIDAVVQVWREMTKRTKQIFSQRDRFVDTLNSMLRGKEAFIGESNDVLFRTDKQTLTPFMLSSGEKQLFILLGEVLLQRNEPYIFVADEPELSLHVTWQERLIASLRSLNESAQILAATHSPDIVGPLHSHAIDMDAIIK